MNPFQQQATLEAQAQTMFGGGTRNGGAMMVFNGVSIPCTISAMVTDFMLVAGGQSPRTYIEQLEFLVSDCPSIPSKGLDFTLRINPQQPAMAMQFWHGGLLPGGLTYRFMAVVQNYEA